uniref:PEX5-related protein n=1 Tax=Amphiprion ocellaris TaxID=80972 RepID=A0AAQ6A8T6_AMPOC
SGQESRPLLSPSIDDFLSESRSDALSVRPISSNASSCSGSAGLCLTEIIRRSVCFIRNKKSGSSVLRKDAAVNGNTFIYSFTVSLSSPLDKWDDVNLEVEDSVRRRRYEKRCTSHHSSSELLWQPDPPKVPQNISEHLVLHLQRETFREFQLYFPLKITSSHMKSPVVLQSDTEFWDKMQAEWEELARRNWLEDSEDQRPIPPTVSPAEKGYYFNTNNPYRDWPNAFTEGQDKAREGDLNAAVLLLEAAILQDPQDSEAWQILGMTQAENENEQAAIVSLQRCLELRPNNLPALMALAVSFTNSGMQREACDALRRWISHNPRYRHLVQEGRSPLRGSPLCELQDVLLLFQEVALLNLDCVDPDLQTGLGVLFNLSSDFNKAVEAFSAALSVRPQDYLLWNRLGATLANGNRSKEAVEAYTRALELQPGFIRSRYNLGISCINMGAHREAVSNFLTALNQQRRTQRCSHQQMSANIWSALRIAISLMDRPELFQAVNIGDLDLLMRAFDMADV